MWYDLVVLIFNVLCCAPLSLSSMSFSIAELDVFPCMIGKFLYVWGDILGAWFFISGLWGCDARQLWGDDGGLSRIQGGCGERSYRVAG